ncbi:hypothetical protein ASA1KI_43640 [Opitutales bacterium ASA1]|uniref:DUF4956 domain-containing protein n=1 Tax=Congregicoccus parvus TaxID=3081749 RepID=UPI002B2F43DD|nr:hypothetical protein ASA1KI_43640 [Opitutales bacterium ASA1]
MHSLLRGDYAALPTHLPTLVLGLLLAFLCGQLIAWIYMVTHRGLSYSRAFVVSLVVMPVLVALVMMVLSNNLVTAFGLMAVFAIVRFRNILRDTLDTAHVLAVIVLGMACGSQKFTTAVVGALLVSALVLYLRWTDFGSRHRHDVVLNLRWTTGDSGLDPLTTLLTRHCNRMLLAGRRLGTEAGVLDLSYRLHLRDPSRVHDLVEDLRADARVGSISCVANTEDSET